MSIDTAALIVVDVQNGFVNLHSRHVVAAVEDLVARWSALGLPVVFTRYFNYPDSPYQRFLDWHQLQEPPETDIVPELTEVACRAHAVVDKFGYTFLTAEARELIDGAGWTDLVFCGIATESCVLKSAADAFEHGYAPWIVTDACASDAGADVHDAGLLVARRLIGLHRLVTREQMMTQVSARFETAVME